MNYVSKMFLKTKKAPEQKVKFLVTGCSGQVGKALIPVLYDKFGIKSLLCSDIVSKPSFVKGEYLKLDVTNKKDFNSIVFQNQINYILHFAGILSAAGEKNPQLAISVNVNGVNNALDVAKDNNTKLFIPSTIAVYGKGHDRYNASTDDPLNPSTIYGITKVYMEQAGSYYHKRFGVNFRSLRYPGFVSPYEYEANGTTDYASQIFFSALKKLEYKHYLSKDRILPMIYIDEGIEGTIQFMMADDLKFTNRIYNLAGLSFSPAEISKEIKTLMPNFKMKYEPDFREEIAATWPEVIDGVSAEKDWGWSPKINTAKKLAVKTLLDISRNNEYKHYFENSKLKEIVQKEVKALKI